MLYIKRLYGDIQSHLSLPNCIQFHHGIVATIGEKRKKTVKCDF